MSHELVHARVLEHVERLRLGHLAKRRTRGWRRRRAESFTFLDFLDALLREEMGAKQRKRVSMGITIAHFPAVKTLEDFDSKVQPSVDQCYRARLLMETWTGWLMGISQDEQARSRLTDGSIVQHARGEDKRMMEPSSGCA